MNDNKENKVYGSILAEFQWKLADKRRQVTTELMNMCTHNE